MAALIALVLGARVFVSFLPVRVVALPQPIAVTDSTLTVKLRNSRLDTLQPPFAVVVRIGTRSTRAERISIALDGSPVCDVAVPAGRSTRYDCAATGAWTSGAAHTVTLAGPSGPWSADYLEVATHSGRSTGFLSAVVLPAGSGNYRRAPVWWAVGLGVLLVAGGLWWRPAVAGGRAGLFSRGLSSVIAALFVGMLIAPAVTRYQVLVSAATFGWLSALASLPWTLVPLMTTITPVAGVIRHYGTHPRELFAAIPARLEMLWHWCDVHQSALMALVAIAVTVSTVAHGARVVGGADEYGYVSQADLWLKGSLEIRQPFVRQLPWPYAGWTFAPLGYRPHPNDASIIVPSYAPGLPMLLALAKGIAGQEAMFYVVPLTTGLLVLGTYALGRRLGTGPGGIVAALLVATCPVVIMMGTSVMTDVPVAAAWTGSLVLLLGSTVGAAAGSGLLAAAAILIRPNLAPLAGLLALYYVWLLRHRDRRRRVFVQLVAFSAGVVAAGVVVGRLNAELYGSPFNSGYGKLSELFALNRVPTNLRLYLQWFVEEHTPIVLAGFAAILVPRRRWWPGVADRGIFFVLSAFVVAVWGIYSAWLVFDAWWFSRFLLSSWPVIMLGAGALAHAAYRSGYPRARTLTVLVVAALVAFQFNRAVMHGSFTAREARRRFIGVADLVRRMTDPNSVVISLDHSGSIRYYGGRTTMLFSWIPGHRLDSIVEFLKAHGVRTYLAAQDWELPEIRERFQGNATLQVLDHPPIASYHSGGEMLLFDLTAPTTDSIVTVVEPPTARGWTAARPQPLRPLVLR
jgi:Dolichyl-phosphate-mannose-protein mannosyltransferase